MVAQQLGIVLLGATGFVGRAVLRRLAMLPRGTVTVRALVRNVAEPLPSFVTPISGELPKSLPSDLFFDSPHVVVHLATKQIDLDGTGFLEVNVRGTEQLLDCLPSSCAGVLYGSSISVYGQGAQQGEDEDAPLRPTTPLAKSRAQAEALILGAAKRRGISAAPLRPRFILGQGDRFTLPALLRLLERRIAVGSGRQAFTVISVDDYAESIVRLATRFLERSLRGTPFSGALHVGCERPLSLSEIFAALSDAFLLPPARWRIPGGTAFPHLLRLMPFEGARSLATRLELIGLPHWVSVGRLAAELGPEFPARDPSSVLAEAIDVLRASVGAPP